jgi:hypothetical protein
MTRDQLGLSARRSRISLCCCRIMASAGQLLEALNPSGVWGGSGRGGAVARTDAAGADAAARKLERMSTIESLAMERKLMRRQ